MHNKHFIFIGLGTFSIACVMLYASRSPIDRENVTSARIGWVAKS